MTQPDFGRVLREAIGLDASSIGSNMLVRAVNARMTCLGIPSAERYWEYLQGSSEELQELIEAVVVPETWFFRDREAFGAMVRLLSGLLFRASDDPQVRILSVPCCTGEEPYSIAMALLDAGLFGDHLKVDAIDVSRSAIVCARRGVYGTNSFRGEDLSFRDRYMERAGDRYRIRETIRHAVRFQQDNIFANSFPCNSDAYDVIFCRNLLIYLDTEKQDLALKKINRLLKPRGYLFVGPAEAVLASRNGFRPIKEAMSFAFRKEQSLPISETASNVARSKPDATPQQQFSSPAFKTPATVAIARHVPANKVSPEVDIGQIQSLANTGQFEQALALCRTFSEENSLTADICYLRGLIHDAKNETLTAVEWYRKAVYLEPEHPEALLHLALLYERQGNSEAATQLRQRAKRVVPTNSLAIRGTAPHGRSK